MPEQTPGYDWEAYDDDEEGKMWGDNSARGNNNPGADYYTMTNGGLAGYTQGNSENEDN